jgi:transcriptional regulator
MYTPRAFLMSDPDVHALIDRVGAASLVATGDDGQLRSTFVPLLRNNDRLLGHVAKANPIHTCSGPVVACFSGVHGYVSPSWYPSKAEHGKVVPTWNYEAVHVHGEMRAIHDKSWLLDVVSRLTNRFEEQVDSQWNVTDAPSDYIDTMLAAIVGIEIVVTDVIGKSKLSQNRPEPDIVGVINGRTALAAADELAQVMTANRPRSNESK